MSLGWIQAIPAIAGVAQSFIGRDAESEIKSLGPQLQALEDARVYREAAINPASPHHRALTALEEAAMKRNLIAAINEQIKQTNRSRARGALGAGINPERRDESLAGALANLMGVSGDQARSSASQKLNQAASSARGEAQGFNSINQIFAAFSDENKSDRFSGLDALGKLAKNPDIIKGIESLFSKGGGGLTISDDAMPLPAGAQGKSIFVGR